MVEPVSVTGVVAIPVMSFQTVSLGVGSRARGVASDQDERIEELDARVEALHLRLVTIQRSVELQTQILEELRDKGTIGGQPIGGIEPAPSQEKQARDALILDLQQLEGRLEEQTEEPASHLRDEVNKLLKLLKNKSDE